MSGNFSSKNGMLCLLAASIFLFGCASRSAQTAGGGAQQGAGGGQFGQQSANTPPILQTGSLTNCFGASAFPANVPNARIIDGRNLLVTVSERPTSLCDVLRATNKKVAIFQFAGSDCLSCKDEAKATQAALRTSGRSLDILHVVGFTDKRGRAAEQEFQTFMQENAPLAFRAHDYDQKMWNYVKPLSRPATLIMNLNMQALAVVDVADEAKIVPFAISLIPPQN